MTDKIEESQAKRRRIPVPVSAALAWIGIYLFLKLFFGSYLHMPLPGSIIFMYMTTATVVILLSVTIFEDTLQGLIGPIIWFMRGGSDMAKPWQIVRLVFLIAMPLYVGHGVYQRTMPRFEPPISSRVIHPSPPPEVSAFSNELRDDEANLEANLKEGARIYYENCHFCHGDKMAGAGHFAHVFNPTPASFDKTTIGMLQESFVFWRVATGGPGLPASSTPWDSSMPVWEDFLSEKEIWQVILYLYDATGTSPRTWEE